MASVHSDSFERPWSALDMAAHTLRDVCFGIDTDGRLAAFVIISCAADQAEVLTIATAKAARRQGLARRLLEGVIPQLQKHGAAELFLEVAEDNTAALALYKTSGFQPIGRRPGYYRRTAGRMGAITFSKKL